MTELRRILVFSISIFILGCSASSQPIASVTSPWAHHCSTQGTKPRDNQEAGDLLAFAVRCEPRDACFLACARSGCAENIGGGCAHVCFAKDAEGLVKQADSWSNRSCRLPPNNSFKPSPLRGLGRAP